jgi:hypothetical protein
VKLFYEVGHGFMLLNPGYEFDILTNRQVREENKQNVENLAKFILEIQ